MNRSWSLVEIAAGKTINSIRVKSEALRTFIGWRQHGLGRCEIRVEEREVLAGRLWAGVGKKKSRGETIPPNNLGHIGRLDFAVQELVPREAAEKH